MFCSSLEALNGIKKTLFLSTEKECRACGCQCLLLLSLAELTKERLSLTSVSQESRKAFLKVKPGSKYLNNMPLKAYYFRFRLIFPNWGKMAQESHSVPGSYRKHTQCHPQAQVAAHQSSKPPVHSHCVSSARITPPDDNSVDIWN